MRKVFRNIHLWLSVPFGLIITLICFSGAMLVFEGEIMQLTHRSLYYVEKTDGKPLPMDKLASKVPGGMYALLLVLVMALTGLTWSFGWYRTAFYTVFGVDTPSIAG